MNKEDLLLELYLDGHITKEEFNKMLEQIRK